MKEQILPTAVRLAEEIEARIDRLAATTGHSKAFHLRELIMSGLDKLEWEYSVAQQATDIRAGRRETVASPQVRHELNLGG